MSQRVEIEIPDEVYRPLMQQAQEGSMTVEETINQWLARVARLGQDRLRRWAGAFESGVPDGENDETSGSV